MTLGDIGFDRALALVLERVRPLAPVSAPVWEAGGLVLADDVRARVDCPGVDASSRDGYAVRSADVAGASSEKPARLRCTGTVVAGGPDAGAVEPGTAVEVMTGAVLPGGADAVVSVEFTRRDGPDVEVQRPAGPGRNVLGRGVDVEAGARVASAGEVVRPALAGLLAAGGLDAVDVHPRPRVALLATGDEVVAPGRRLRPGQVHASNLVVLEAWVRSFSMPCSTTVVSDDPGRIRACLEDLMRTSDVILTCGGAWKSARDRTVEVLGALGFDVVFHGVRLAPGKAAALAVRDDVVALCLPGGPPSNEMAFLQLALPGLLALAGRRDPPFPRTIAVLAREIRKQRSDPDWTNFFHARLVRSGGRLVAEPLIGVSRLVGQARAGALVLLPAGVMSLPAGAECSVQVLEPGVFDTPAPGP